MSDEADGWSFSIADGSRWRGSIPAAPTEERKREFWDRAVPLLAEQNPQPPPVPCVVVCRVAAPGHWGNPPGGPMGRAKGLLDALHDDRRSGPKYADLGAPAPLSNDDPGCV